MILVVHYSKVNWTSGIVSMLCNQVEACVGTKVSLGDWSKEVLLEDSKMTYHNFVIRLSSKTPCTYNFKAILHSISKGKEVEVVHNLSIPTLEEEI